MHPSSVTPMDSTFKIFLESSNFLSPSLLPPGLSQCHTSPGFLQLLLEWPFCFYSCPSHHLFPMWQPEGDTMKKVCQVLTFPFLSVNSNLARLILSYPFCSLYCGHTWLLAFPQTSPAFSPSGSLLDCSSAWNHLPQIYLYVLRPPTASGPSWPHHV